METVSILETKLYYPSRRSNFIHRRRLVDKLRKGSKRKFTLICAPAGYGKTTLLSDWIRNSDRPAAWLSLDEEDSEIDCFLTYFIAALQKLDSAVGLEIQAALSSSKRLPVKSLLTKLVGEIGAIDQDFIVVLDDYHQITAKPVHDALEFLLNHLPVNAHLVISGRAEPPLSLSSFRVREQMTEIRASDLRFTEEEADSFLNSAMGLDLSSDEIAALESRTEGWIASLQLAALSLQGQEDTKNFVNAFSGSHRFVLDYLIDEVLSHQKQEIKTFLIRTSILERLSGPLCDHLLGIEASQKILAQLDRDNLFLVPLDDERRWFRYHHLFADLLSQRLKQEEPGIIEELHGRAAGWFVENGLTPQAISHALTAKDYDKAAEIIESISGAMVEQGRLGQVLSWTGKLPDHVISNHPRAALSRAWACLLTGKINAVEMVLKGIEARLSESDWVNSPDSFGILGDVRTIRVFLSSGTGDLRRDIETALEVHQDLPAESVSNKNALATHLGYLYMACGELDSATSFFEEVRERVIKAGGNAVICIDNLGDIQAARGCLRQAQKTYEGSLKVTAKRTGDEFLHGDSHAEIGLGKIFYEHNDLDRALSHFVRGIAIGEQNSQVGSILKGNLAMAKLRQAQGEIDAAYDVLARAKEVAARAYRAPEAVQITSWEAGLWLADDNLGAACNWADERIDLIKGELNYTQRIEHIMLARIMISQEKTEEALALLSRLLESAKAGGHIRDAIEILAVKAIAEQAISGSDERLDTIIEALDLAEPEGYIRTFIDNGEPMAYLLRQVASAGKHTQYVEELLRVFRQIEKKDLPGNQSTSPANEALFNPLTARELEVLTLIVDRLKYIEIAERLVVSINTVRTHAKNIYRKLGVNNRADAIDKVRELHLI